jgi:hypothetical protein
VERGGAHMNEMQPVGNEQIKYESEQLYTPSEVSEVLGIKDATLRTWAGKMIKLGYKFYEVRANQRGYFRWDVDCLREIQKSIHDEKLSLDNSILYGVRKYASNVSKNTGVPNREIELKTDEIRLSKQDLMEVVELAVKNAIKLEREEWEIEQEDKFKTLQQKLLDTVEARDRSLMTSIRKDQEQLRLELAAAEEERMKQGIIKRTLNKLFKQQVN